MPAPIHVTSMFAKIPTDCISVDTTSRSGQWAGLSPFLVGPCPIYPGACPATNDQAMNLENLWQYTKVYQVHAGPDGTPTDQYWNWARTGWADQRAHRYPMGKGARPLYSLWDGVRLGYILARQKIYAPCYAKAVRTTQAFRDLQSLMETNSKPIVLRDYDGYDHEKLGMSLTEAILFPDKKFGHSFVLKALLTEDPVLKLCGL